MGMLLGKLLYPDQLGGNQGNREKIIPIVIIHLMKRNSTITLEKVQFRHVLW